ncbi:MAG: co-chaperone DjlA [bacterium]
MSWWGKLVGGAFGFMLGGPLGALLGAALGHNFDKGIGNLDVGDLGPGAQQRVQTAFFTATFAVMGRVAKADGRVSPDEIRMAEAVMNQMDLRGPQRDAAKRLFSEGKQDNFPLEDVLDQFRQECRNRTTLLRLFLEIQLNAAYADGTLHVAEERLLLHICAKLGISEQEFRRIQQMIEAEINFGQGGRAGGGRPASGPSLADAYRLLGVSEKDSDKDVKRAYRRMLSQHHPDKLVAKGLPEEMMKVAAQKTHEIKQAWEQIKRARGL